MKMCFVLLLLSGTYTDLDSLSTLLTYTVFRPTHATNPGDADADDDADDDDDDDDERIYFNVA